MRRVFGLVLSVASVLFVTAPAARAATIQNIFNPTDQYFSANPGGSSNAADCTATNPDGTAAGDLINGADDTDGCKSLEYTIILSGYSNPPDTGISAELTLTLIDNDDNSPETVVLTLDDNLEGTHTMAEFPYSVSVTSQVQADGSLKINIAVGDQGQGQADFIFDKSVLDASWTDGEDPDPNNVPEPATMLLTGVGLGVAGLRRRFSAS